MLVEKCLYLCLATNKPNNHIEQTSVKQHIMFWYTLIYVILLIIAFADSYYPSRERAKYDESLAKMNSDIGKKIICGVISLVAALLPIIDYLAKEENHYHSEGPIFHADYVTKDGPIICFALSVIVVIFWVIWMLVNAGYKQSNAEKLNKMITDEENRQARIAAQKASEEKENNQVMEELTAKYGKPEQIIQILDNRRKNSFMVFPAAQSVYVQSKVIPYSQIVSCEVKDESYTTVTGTKEEVTKTSTGSMAGRALVGGLIAGPVGAVVGGATAKKKTEVIDNTKTITHHHYYVIMTLADVSTPMVKIDCGKTNPRIAEKIKALLIGILSQRAAKPVVVAATPPKSIADELAKLAVLKEQGILTDEEFAQQKQRLLSAETRPIELTAENQMAIGDQVQGPYEDPVVKEVEEWVKAGMVQLAAKKYKEAKGCSMDEAQDFVDQLRIERGL